MLNDPASGLANIIGRVPPVTGDIRIPRDAFEKLLRKKRLGKKSEGRRASA